MTVDWSRWRASKSEIEASHDGAAEGRLEKLQVNAIFLYAAERAVTKAKKHLEVSKVVLEMAELCVADLRAERARIIGGE